jgi:acetoacetate decarboxylase
MTPSSSSLLSTPSMPMAAPSYPKGPYRFVQREYCIIAYESDPSAIRAALPAPLEPAEHHQVLFEVIRMPDSTGFGSYTESGVVIPALYHGEKVNFVAQMYLDCEPPIAGGREIWGFPKKAATPKLNVTHDTLTGTLDYAEERVALATMGYKFERFPIDEATQALGKTQVNFKLIPDVDGQPALCQLVAYNLTDIQVKGAWRSPARLHLIPHVNAPVADLPVRRILQGTHLIAD